MRLSSNVVLSLAAVAVLVGCGASDGSPPQLQLDGVGPLKLKMSSSSALKTKWLAKPKFGCRLGGQPWPVVYELTGPDAPNGLTGYATLHRGQLVNIEFEGSGTTSEGVTLGKTTIEDMRGRYRAAGFRVESEYEEVFQTTFVTVKRGERYVMMASAPAKTITSIAVPSLPLCD